MRLAPATSQFLILLGMGFGLPSELRAEETVFVQFEGQSLTAVPPGNQDNAALGQSQALNRLNLTELYVPPFLSPDGFDKQQFIQFILSQVAKQWLGIDVKFVANRPADGNYTMIIVGGRAELLNGRTDAGWAPNDCHNESPHEVGYVFSETIEELFGTLDPDRLAATISAEYAHTVGLEHVMGSNDLIMQPVIITSASYRFSQECLPLVGALPPSHPEYCDEHPGCELGFQNDWLHLLDRLGPAGPPDESSTTTGANSGTGTSGTATDTDISSTGITGADTAGTGTGGSESSFPLDDDGNSNQSCACSLPGSRDWIWSAFAILLLCVVRRRSVLS